MKLKGKHIINYIIEGEKKSIIVEVKLKQIEGTVKPFQNIWYGVATVNEKNYEDPALEYCVNAEFMAERIALDHIKKLRAEHGRKLRIKRKK